MKVLITGGAGFIGYHLAHSYLKNENLEKLYLVDNLSRGIIDADLEKVLADPRVVWMPLDLLDPQSMDQLPRDVQIIYHLAAIIGVKHVMEKPYKVLTDNVKLLDHMIGYAKSCSQLTRFLFASTSEVYAGSADCGILTLPTPENQLIALADFTSPRRSYLLSKLYGEAMCHHSGLPFTLFRPHNFFGPRMGMAHVVPELFRKIIQSNGSQIPIASPSHKRTFCYIQDAVNVLMGLAVSREALGRAYNVGNSTPEISISELARKIATQIGYKETAFVDGEDTPGSPSRRCPSTTAIEKLLDYKPEYSLEKGIQSSFAWYQSRVFSQENPVCAI